MLTMDEGWVEVLQSMIVGGGPDGPGGMAVVDVAQNSLLSVGDAVGDKLIIRNGGTVIVDNSTARENVSRIARNLGWEMDVDERAEDDIHLVFTK